MILVSIMGKIPDVRRKSKGFDLVFQDLYVLGVYCPVFGKNSWVKNEAGKKESDFSDTQQVRTTRCTLLFFWGGSKVNYNIGNPAFRVRPKTAYFSSSFLTAKPDLF